MQQQTTTRTKSKDKTKNSMQEGKLTRGIETQTAKLPSTLFLALAGSSLLLSVGLAASNRNKSWANFVGLWVPTFLLFGIYNKIVKTNGSDRAHKGSYTIH